MSSTEFTGIRFTRMCGAAVTLRRNPGSDTGVFRGIYSLEDLGAARIRLSASSTSFPRVIENYDSSAQGRVLKVQQKEEVMVSSWE